MGYRIEQRDCDFRIKAENVDKARDAIKALANRVSEGGGFTSSGGQVRERYFSWVRTEDFANADTLEDALRPWRWDIEFNGNGNGSDDVDWIMFHGEKYGDEDILLAAIAPYVEPGCFIEMQGEDGALWRWTFDGATMTEKCASITWE
jgi:hypothetical protein